MSFNTTAVSYALVPKSECSIHRSPIVYPYSLVGNVNNALKVGALYKATWPRSSSSSEDKGSSQSGILSSRYIL